MTSFTLTATELKNNTAAVINEVVFAKKEAIINRHGRPVARIIPVIKLETVKSKKAILDKYFGSIKDFPEVSKSRHFRPRKINL